MVMPVLRGFDKRVNPVFQMVEGMKSIRAVIDMNGNIPIPMVLAIPICIELMINIARSRVCVVITGLHSRIGQRSSHHTKNAVIARSRFGYSSKYWPN